MKKVIPNAFANGIEGAGSHPLVVNIPLQTLIYSDELSISLVAFIFYDFNFLPRHYIFFL